MATKVCTRCGQEKPVDRAHYDMVKTKKGDQKPRPECRECSRAMTRSYKARNGGHISEYNHQYKATHREETTAYNRVYFAMRRLDPEFRIKANTRSRLAGIMRGVDRAHSPELLSCSYDEFIHWLKYQFEPGMTMGNYGSYWQLDHVMPCASFNLDDPVEHKKCFHWSNIRPCEASENITKNSKIDDILLEWHGYMVEEFLREHAYDTTHSLYTL